MLLLLSFQAKNVCIVFDHCCHKLSDLLVEKYVKTLKGLLFEAIKGIYIR